MIAGPAGAIWRGMDDLRPLPAAPGFVALNPRRGRRVLGWSFMVLGVLGCVLPFLQGFLFLALGLFVLRDQYLWAADRWAWVARRWPGAVAKVEELERGMSARVAGWGERLRRALGRGPHEAPGVLRSGPGEGRPAVPEDGPGRQPPALSLPPMIPAAPRRPVGRGRVLLLVLVTVLAWAPVVLAVLSSVAASALGCTVNEAAVHPCTVAGLDIGEPLAVMFLMGWVAILALPAMLGTLVGWFVVWTRRAWGRGAQQAGRSAVEPG